MAWTAQQVLDYCQKNRLPVPDAIKSPQNRSDAVSAVLTLPGTGVQQGAARRAKPPAMNKTEQDFERILRARKERGEILTYKFQGMRLLWGDCMYYKADFVARGADGVTYLYEIKGGHIWSRDLVRFRGCRAEWTPYHFEFELWQRKRGQWTRLE